METIASFKVNHDKLQKGMYISRIDGDIVTYDIRMKRPNNKENDYLPTPASHTFEHLFATYARNTEFANNVIYIGPMGCRTGFYFLVRDKINHEQALKIIQDCMEFIINFEGKIPGSNKEECGNYKEHNLEGAKAVARDMKIVLQNWTTEKMIYEE